MKVVTKVGALDLLASVCVPEGGEKWEVNEWGSSDSGEGGNERGLR